MKLFFLFFLFAPYCYAQQIPPDSAKYHEGSLTTVCGNVTSVHTGETGTVFINFGNYPHQDFTAVVFKDDVSKLRYDLKTLKGKEVCIIGTVKIYKTQAEIIVKQKNQIRMQDE